MRRAHYVVDVKPAECLLLESRRPLESSEVMRVMRADEVPDGYVKYRIRKYLRSKYGARFVTAVSTRRVGSQGGRPGYTYYIAPVGGEKIPSIADPVVVSNLFRGWYNPKTGLTGERLGL